MSDASEEDFREFAASQIDDLRRLAYLTCGNWQTSEDAVSIGLTKLYLAWHRVVNPHRYARRVVMNAAVDQLRKPWRREHPTASPGHLDRAMPGPADELAERDRLQRALLRVPPRQRAVLLLRFYEDLGIEEVAQILRRSTGTIKSQTARGLSALRRDLEDEGSFGSERSAQAVKRGPA